MSSAASDKQLARFDAALATLPGQARKGKKTPYAAVNGHMFAFVDPEGAMCLRLSPEDKAAHETTFGAQPVIQYGAVMRGYVFVPEQIMEDAAARDALFTASHGYVSGLKPK